MNGFLKTVADAVFPPRFTCDLCGRETFDGRNLCPECAETVTMNDGLTCPVCGRRTALEGLCFECKADIPAYDRAVSAMVYSDGGVKLITKFKRGGAYLKAAFADAMTDKCRELKDADCISYIPMTEKAERKRGYNQSRLLAEEIAERLNLPIVKVLEKVKETKEQKSLTKKERESNLKGCFAARKADCEGRTFIIVDDVMTTGATAGEAARILKRKGAKKVYIATMASVEYKREV